MNRIERTCAQIRHHPFFEDKKWLWILIRPVYNAVHRIIFHSGTVRNINGADPIRVHSFAWSTIGTSSESLLALLESLGYQVEQIDGRITHRIDSWGGIVARKTAKNNKKY